MHWEIGLVVLRACMLLPGAIAPSKASTHGIAIFIEDQHGQLFCRCLYRSTLCHFRTPLLVLLTLTAHAFAQVDEVSES